jgi:PHD-finger
VERQNGADDSDQSQSGTESSSSESDDGSKKDAVEADPALTGRSKRKKDPLYLLTDQKRSLEELINEVAASSNLEGIRICSICLWDEYDIEKDAVVQCDSCGVAVHEGCYGVIGKDLEEIHAKDKDLDSQSSTETMPWFCDPCRFGQRNPICLACPTQFGAFKQTVKVILNEN